MKKQFFFSMLAAAAMFASCSSDDAVVENNAAVAPGEDGYVAFNIQMPTTGAVTRSDDQFSDGDPIPEEYAVHNATLFLFKGASESVAKFEAIYELNVKSFSTTGTPAQCTSEGIVSKMIDNPTLGVSDKLYAFIMINNNSLVDVANKTLGGMDLTNYNSTSVPYTFQQFSEIVLDNIGNTSEGLVMTNCPVNCATPTQAVAGTHAPTTSNIITLTELDPAKIYTTEAQAEANPAGEVFVERAAAKVTVKKGSLSGTLTSTPAVTYDAGTIKWELINQNQVYYNARQMEAGWLGLAAINDDGAKAEGAALLYNAANLFRFASASAIHSITLVGGGSAEVVRTYWGKDPNYTTVPTGANAFTTNPTTFAKALTVAGVSGYTFENTFSVDKQSSTNTTMVGFAVTFNGGETFYTVNTLGENDILLIPTSGKSGKKIQDYISEYLQNNNHDFKAWYDANPGENDITVTMTDDDLTGTATVASVAKVSSTAPALPGSITPALINSYLTKIKYYKSGIAYYNARIKHFGAELDNKAETPWVAANHKTSNVTGVYKTVVKGGVETSLSDAEANQNYLGRYGVLRNNWYILTVDAIKKIGQPKPGDPSNPSDPFFPDTPDDEVENYISVKIHITPWALRKQSVTL